MLTLRLQRVGRKNQAAFRIVLAEKQRAVQKKVVEVIGHYNPRTKEFGVKDEDRLRHWIEQRVAMSPTVHNLLVDKGFVQSEKVQTWKPKKKDEKAEASDQESKTQQSAEEQPSQEAEAKTDEEQKKTDTQDEAQKSEGADEEQESPDAKSDAQPKDSAESDQKKEETEPEQK